MKYHELKEGQFFFMTTYEDERKLYRYETEGELVAIDCENGLDVKIALAIKAGTDIELAHIGAQKKITVMFELNEEELSERSSGLATAEMQAYDHRRNEDHHKDMAKAEKTYAEKWEAKRHKLANAVKYQKEERECTPCPEIFDYIKGIATIIHPVHGEIIQTRTLQGDERTPPLIEEPVVIEDAVVTCPTCDKEDCICDKTIAFDAVQEEDEEEGMELMEEQDDGIITQEGEEGNFFSEDEMF